MTPPNQTGPAGFRGALAFLSNFHPSPLTGRDGLVYPTAEHAYHACKTDDPAWRERIRTAPTPAAAKALGRRAPLRPDWDATKRATMRRVLAAKFGQHPDLLRALLATTGELVEANTWHDRYWGVCVCATHRAGGQNHLGRLLTELRDLQRPGAYREVTGDLFALDPQPQALVNSINCRGAMGRGVALAFKAHYPDMYDAYKADCAKGLIKPGDVWVWRPGSRSKHPVVLNVAVKDDWRQPARMEWIERGLRQLRDARARYGVSSLALPHIGAANGWLPWAPIRAAVRAALGDAPGLDVTLVAYP